MDPPRDDAHPVGAQLRSPTATSASRQPRGHPQGQTPADNIRNGSLADLPYHPHIQHANLGVTSVYLQGIDSSEIISTVHGRPSPTISATAASR